MNNVTQQSITLALTAEDLAYIHELIAAEDVADESRHLDEEPPKGILFRLVSIDDATAHPQFAGFATADEAFRFRHQQGGWVFKPEEGLVLWFAHTFTPSDILTHTATRGLNGTLL